MGKKKSAAVKLRDLIPKKKTIPWHLLSLRINTRLKPINLQLCKSRKTLRKALGTYYIVEISTGNTAIRNVDPGELAREIGALKYYEEVKL